MNNQKGIAPVLILILIGLALIIFAATQIFGFNPFAKKLTPPATKTQEVDVNDPKYNLVKDKYGLSEEQIKILSTVDDDREL